MTDQTTPQLETKKQVFMVTGASGTGKSSSLANMRKPEGVLYLNCEVGKALPFASGFKEMNITDPKQVHGIFEKLIEKDDKGEFVKKNYHTVVIDSLSFLMDMYEARYVVMAEDSRAGWVAYKAFFDKLMKDYVAQCPQNVIFYSHVAVVKSKDSTLPDAVQAAVKGALKERNIEAYFTTVVSTKIISLDTTILKNVDPAKSKTLREMTSDILVIDPDDEVLGRIHVFQTKPIHNSVGEKIKSPRGLFKLEEAFMNNCAQALLDKLCVFYKTKPLN